VTPFGYLILVGWIPLTVLVFPLLPPRRAVLVTLLAGWLFLPMARVPVSGFPDLTKFTAMSVGPAIGAALFDGAGLLAFRPRWFDAPIVAFCLWPLPSALAAGLGPYEGLSAVLQQVITYGLPYLLGRIYLTDRPALAETLFALCAAALVYLPLVWYEMRMSPQLHNGVYGFHQHAFDQTRRFGGWRPQVFMQHGLALALFLATASVGTLGLWLGGIRRRVLLVPVGAATLLIGATTILCRSVGAVVLLAGGVVLLMATRHGRRSGFVLLMFAVATGIMAGRLLGALETDPVIEAFASVFDEERVESLRFRLVSEDVLLERIKERPILGWGPTGEFRTAASGADLVVATDGFWVIISGQYGLLGFASYLLALLVPALRALRQASRTWTPVGTGVLVAAVGILLGMHLIDILLNAHPTPLFLMLAGGLGTISVFGSAGRSESAALDRWPPPNPRAVRT
jgi:O-antigen ligase